MSQQKNVVVFAPLWGVLPAEGYGGIERVTLDRAKHLGNIGYTVQLIANTDRTDLADEVLVAKRVFKFPKSKSSNIRWFLSLKWTSYLSSFSKLSGKIWEAPILSDAASMDPFNNYFLAHSMGKERLLYFLHGNYYFTNGVGKPLFYPLDKITKASWLVNYGALNKRLNNLLKSKGFKCNYMPNGIELPSFSLVRGDDDGYLLFVGILTREKAPHFAIKIAEKLNLPLKIVGPIGDRSYFDSFIKNHIGNNIEYLGEVPRSFLNEIISGAKCLLFTSDWNDPQPAVVLEAMSYGIPVLALNNGYFSGVYDIIDNFQNGYIGSMDDVLLNAERVFAIDRHTIYTKTKAKWSWEYVLSKYHVPVIEKLREDYES